MELALEASIGSLPLIIYDCCASNTAVQFLGDGYLQWEELHSEMDTHLAVNAGEIM